jgi:hypothetical protein
MVLAFSSSFCSKLSYIALLPLIDSNPIINIRNNKIKETLTIGKKIGFFLYDIVLFLIFGFILYIVDWLICKKNEPAIEQPANNSSQIDSGQQEHDMTTETTDV